MQGEILVKVEVFSQSRTSEWTVLCFTFKYKAEASSRELKNSH